MSDRLSTISRQQDLAVAGDATLFLKRDQRRIEAASTTAMVAKPTPINIMRAVGVPARKDAPTKGTRPRKPSRSTAETRDVSPAPSWYATTDPRTASAVTV